jgi:hypothetical protein
VAKVDAAVPTAVFDAYVKEDKTHHLRVDSVITAQGVENRALLCFIAKYPEAMVATGSCPNPTQAVRQAGTRRRPPNE